VKIFLKKREFFLRSDFGSHFGLKFTCTYSLSGQKNTTEIMTGKKSTGNCTSTSIKNTFVFYLFDPQTAVQSIHHA
jgi:hypothetical protein